MRENSDWLHQLKLLVDQQQKTSCSHCILSDIKGKDSSNLSKEINNIEELLNNSVEPDKRSSCLSCILFSLDKTIDTNFLYKTYLVFKELCKGKKIMEIGIFVVPQNVLDKFSRFSADNETEGIVFIDVAMLLVSQVLNNKERTRKLIEKFEKKGIHLFLSIDKKLLLNEANWISVSAIENSLYFQGTTQFEKELLSNYSEKMFFASNTKLFSKYIGFHSYILGKHRLELLHTIDDYFKKIGNRPYCKTGFLPEEMLLYMLPILKMQEQDENLIPMFMARSAEPFYHAWWTMLIQFSKHELVINSIYQKIQKRLSDNMHVSYIVSSSINSFLTDYEVIEVIPSHLWDEIIEYCKSMNIFFEVNTFLNKEWKVAGGLNELRNRRISRSEAVRYLSGFELDERFINYHNTVRNTQFPDFLWPEKFTKEGVLMEEFYKSIKRYNHSLKYKLSDSAMKQLYYGLKLLSENKGSVNDNKLLFEQRNIINYHMMIFGDTPLRGNEFRDSIQHGARPLLSLLLQDTSFSRLLAKNKDPMVLYTDETSTTCTTLYICELVTKAFHENTIYRTCNFSNRTENTRRKLKDAGILDYVFKDSVCVLEDINEICHGVFLFNENENRKKFYPFSQLIEYLWKKQFQQPEFSGWTKKQFLYKIEVNNRFLDEFIGNHPDDFKFFDQLTGLRNDPLEVKRMMIKSIIVNEENGLMDEIIQNNYFSCFTIFEMDNISTYILRKNLKKLKGNIEFQNLIPSEIKAWIKKINMADQASELENYVRTLHKLTCDILEIASFFNSHRQFNKMIIEYLKDENADFHDLSNYFYENYIPLEASTYSWKKAIFNDAGVLIRQIIDEKPSDVEINSFSSGLVIKTITQNEDEFPDLTGLAPQMKRAIVNEQKKLARTEKILREFLLKSIDIKDTNKHLVATIIEIFSNLHYNFPGFLQKKYNANIDDSESYRLVVRKVLRKKFEEDEISTERFLQLIIQYMNRDKLFIPDGIVKSPSNYRLGGLIVKDWLNGNDSYSNLKIRRREVDKRLMRLIILNDTLVLEKFANAIDVFLDMPIILEWSSHEVMEINLEMMRIASLGELAQNEKNIAQDQVLEIFNKLEKNISDSSYSLESSIRIAAIGNFLDHADPNASKQAIDNEKYIDKFMDEQFFKRYFWKRNDIELLSNKIDQPDLKILYVFDNAGEDVTDFFLIKQLAIRGHNLTLAGRSLPSANDSTKQDIERLLTNETIKEYMGDEIGHIKEVIDTGSAVLGTYLYRMNKEFIHAWQTCDLIIFKGQANYFTVREYYPTKDCFFLLRVKWTAEVANRYSEGDFVAEYYSADR